MDFFEYRSKVLKELPYFCIEKQEIPLSSGVGATMREERLFTGDDSHWALYKIVVQEGPYCIKSILFGENTGILGLYPNPYWFTFNVGEPLVKVLEGFRELYACEKFSKASLDEMFSPYPYLKDTVRINILDKTRWDFEGKYISYHDRFSKRDFGCYCIKDSSFVKRHIEHLREELPKVKLDMSILKQSFYEKYGPRYEAFMMDTLKNIPPWLLGAIAVGSVFALKFAAKSIAQNVDFDFDFDGDDNSTNELFGDFGDNSDNGAYAVSFGGTPKGFIDDHNSFSVPTMGGGPSVRLHSFTKPGSNAVWVSDGSSSPVSLTGKSWVTIGSHKFNVSDILKNK